MSKKRNIREGLNLSKKPGSVFIPELGPIEVEYVDPAESECEECKCSFGIHLKTCSKFRAVSR